MLILQDRLWQTASIFLEDKIKIFKAASEEEKSEFPEFAFLTWLTSQSMGGRDMLYLSDLFLGDKSVKDLISMATTRGAVHDRSCQASILYRILEGNKESWLNSFGLCSIDSVSQIEDAQGDMQVSHSAQGLVL